MKPIRWLDSSLDDLRTFPEAARKQAGYELYRVQTGEMPTDWKPMASVGHGVYEIRVRTGLEHRVFYVAKFAEAVYVIHAFEKKTRKTPAAALEMASRRLAELMKRRKER